jgi:tryptophan synthase alpha chain
VIFSYANPLLRMGLRRSPGSGRLRVDGVLALDLPIEEAGNFHDTLTAAGLDAIFLESNDDRREDQRAAEMGGGFCMASRLGVTGARAAVASGARALVGRIRAHTSMPIALGFGISRPEHVREVCGYADAAVVGSALVSLIAEEGTSPVLVDRVEGYVRWLKGDKLSRDDHYHS